MSALMQQDKEFSKKQGPTWYKSETDLKKIQSLNDLNNLNKKQMKYPSYDYWPLNKLVINNRENQW